jgi:hypothetical protein
MVLKVIGTCVAESMTLNGRDEEVPVALVRRGQTNQDLLYLSLVGRQVGLLEIGISSSDGLIVSVTAVNVQKANVTILNVPYDSPAAAAQLVPKVEHLAPRVGVSHWGPLTEFEDRFINENADVRYICYRDAISLEWAREAAAEQLEDGQVTWLVNGDRCLVGLVIRRIRANVVSMFKATLVAE